MNSKETLFIELKKKKKEDIKHPDMHLKKKQTKYMQISHPCNNNLKKKKTMNRRISDWRREHGMKFLPIDLNSVTRRRNSIPR